MAAPLALLLFFFGGVTIRPYVPPKLDPEPVLEPSDTKVVEIVRAADEWDTNVLTRPYYLAPLAGQVLRGARVAVRGEVKLPDSARGCSSRLYYALAPFGYICSTETRPTDQPPTTKPTLELVEGTPLPYRYVMVLVDEGTTVPMWASPEDLRAHAQPERQLGRGDTVAIEGDGLTFEGAHYLVSVDRKVIPAEHTRVVQRYSQWEGVAIDDSTHLPFGWVRVGKAPVYDAPDGHKIDELARRTRVDVLEEQKLGRTRWLRVGDGRWMKDKHLNEVRRVERPSETSENPQWFDVDLGEQVIVAYRDDKPVYATLTSSGREPHHTPVGNYPVWNKASAITMKSQPYDDVSYYVDRVPWVMFFQAHNALHGAYWHDRFGITKSHGCVNLSPKDARHLFEWLQPQVPAGFSAVRYWDLTQAPVVHVHNSHRMRDIFQERNIGPPDKNDEAERLDKAIARREAEAAAAAQAAGEAPPTAPLTAASKAPIAPALAPPPAAAQAAAEPPQTAPATAVR